MATKGKGDAKDGEEDGDLFVPIKEVLTKLKQGPMNFGCYLTSDKEKPVVLAAHKRKAPEALGKQAKKKAETPKGAFGTLTLEEGGVLSFLCATEDAPAALGKRIRMMLKAEGLAKFKVVVRLPGGAELGEPDAEDDEAEDGAKTARDPALAGTGGAGPAKPQAEAAPPAGSTAAPDAGPPGDDEALEALRAEVTAEFDALCKTIDAAADQIPAPVVRRIDGLRTMFATEIARDPRKGAGIVTLLKKTVEAAGLGTEAAPEVLTGPASRASALADLEKGIDALLAMYS